MLILILGVALWWAAHLYKRVAPASRASMASVRLLGVAPLS